MPRTRALLFCLALLWTQAGAASLEPSELLEQAARAARSGDPSLALTWLDPLLVNPAISRSARAEAYYMRGIIHYARGMYRLSSQDHQRALEFDPTHVRARNALAWLYLNGRGVPESRATAVSIYRLAARQGHEESRLNLALLLMKGDRARRDVAEALHWLTRLAEAGNPEGAALAGQVLARGDAASGIAPDTVRARALLETAAAAGHDGAALELAILLQPVDPEAARQHLEQAARAGMARAQRRLGMILSDGTSDDDADAEVALMWFREAAKQGDAYAQSWLGWAYDAGYGVAPDGEQALRWYTRAARRDDSSAQVNLGNLLLAGGSVPRDEEQALYWFERAATQGELAATSAMAWLLATSPDDALRDGERALRLATELIDRERSSDHLQALAAALAETGDFEGATRTQLEAIDVLQSEFDQAARGGQPDTRVAEERAARYRSGEPLRNR